VEEFDAADKTMALQELLEGKGGVAAHVLWIRMLLWIQMTLQI